MFVALTWPRAAFAVGVLCGVAVLTKAVAVSGTFPEYAACLQDAGYAPLEAPPPVVALMR